MPLIQRGLARAYYRPENEFVVGIQELDASDLVVTSYSKTIMMKQSKLSCSFQRSGKRVCQIQPEHGLLSG